MLSALLPRTSPHHKAQVLPDVVDTRDAESRSPTQRKAGLGPPKQQARLVAKANWVDIACLTILSSTTMGATGWNLLLAEGFLPGFVCLLLSAATYVAMTFCLSEMVSAIPFSGGTYGFARVTLGKHVGLYVGLCSGLQYILRGAMLCDYAGEAIVHATGMPHRLKFLINAALIVAVTIHQSAHGASHWLRLRCWVVVVTAFLLFYLCACLFSGMPDLSTHGKLDPKDHTMHTWMHEDNAVVHTLPYAIMLYLGAEVGPLAAEDTIDPRVNVPKGMLCGLGYVITCMIVTFLVGSSMPPGVGDIGHSKFPMTPTLHAVFGSTSPGYHLLAVPGLYATMLANSFAYGRVYYSLARAGLIPNIYTLVTKKDGVPYAALILGGVLSYLVSLLMLLDGGNEWGPYRTLIWYMTLFACLSNVGTTMHSFYLLRLKHSEVTRFFISPLGYPGAICALCVLSVTFLGCFFANDKLWVVMVVQLVLLTLGMSYYLIWGYRYLKLSPEEAFAQSNRVTAEKMLSTGLGYAYLLKQCEKEYSTENIECWQAIDRFVKAPTVVTFKQIFDTYLRDGALNAVNVPSSLTKAIEEVHASLLIALEQEAEARLTVPTDARFGLKLTGRDGPKHDIETGRLSPRMSSKHAPSSSQQRDSISDDLMAAVQQIQNRMEGALGERPTTPGRRGPLALMHAVIGRREQERG